MTVAPLQNDPVVKPATKFNVGRFLLRRLSEVSTYRGAILILTAMGCVIDPDAAEKITALGLAIAGVLGMFFPDKTPGDLL